MRPRFPPSLARFRKGFSLVEIVLCIGIVGSVVVVLFGLLSGLSDQVRTVQTSQAVTQKTDWSLPGVSDFPLPDELLPGITEPSGEAE